MYVRHPCILFPHLHTHHHHISMAYMHIISSWTYPLQSCMYCIHIISTLIYPLPSCMYGMLASYLHMDISTTIIYVRHACMQLISTWTYPPPSCMYGMHASYLHMDIPTTIMYVWHACILSPHGHTHHHHVCMACTHLISTWRHPLPPSMYDMHAYDLHMDIPITTMYVYHACI